MYALVTLWLHVSTVNGHHQASKEHFVKVVTKLMVAFRNFSKAPKNVAINLVINFDLQGLQFNISDKWHLTCSAAA